MAEMVGSRITAAGKRIFIKIHPEVSAHLDEIFAALLIKWFADDEFIQRYAQDGVIGLGTGAGDFNEHPGPGGIPSRKEGECCATLVAKALGVQDDPGLQRMLKGVLLGDTKGHSSSDWAAFARTIGREVSFQAALKWVETAFEAEYQEQTRFWGKTAEEYKRVARIEDIRIGNRQVRLAILQSNNPQIGGYARHVKGGGADITIQRQESDHTQIVAKWPIPDVARLIWVAERQMEGLEDVEDSVYRLIRLAGEGSIPGAEKWHFHWQKQAISNGGPNGNQDKSPTKLPLGQIVAIVNLGLDWSQLSPGSPDSPKCPKSRCLFRGCGWYTWGLERCEQIRQRSSPSRR